MEAPKPVPQPIAVDNLEDFYKNQREQEKKHRELALQLRNQEDPMEDKRVNKGKEEELVKQPGEGKQEQEDKKVEGNKQVVEIEFPLYWVPQKKDHEIFLVEVDSMEWNSIVDRFAEGMQNAQVTKVQRNQNK